MSRLSRLVYPNGFSVDYSYNERGYLEDVSDSLDATVYYQVNEMNAADQITEELFGNTLVTQRDYDSETGLVTAIQTLFVVSPSISIVIQDLTFVFDELGNLTRRDDLNQDRRDKFLYDSLNRLTQVKLRDTASSSTLNTVNLTYSGAGNIDSKSDVGSYGYGAGGAGPHAVTSAGGKSYSYDANGSMVASGGDSFSWSSFNKPIGFTGLSGDVFFSYGIDRKRTKQEIGSTRAILYAGQFYEKQKESGADDELVSYIYAGDARVAIHTEVDDGDPATDKVRYLHKDHLGSITLLTDESGGLAEDLSYDSHGKRRETDWQPAASPIFAQETRRGFTDHEHIDEMGLIHMNGRVYEPTLGRFLSANNYVETPETTQGLNRYTYVHNNPLSFTSPDGFAVAPLVTFSILVDQIRRAVQDRIQAADPGGMAVPFGGGYISGALSGAVSGSNNLGSDGGNRGNAASPNSDASSNGNSRDLRSNQLAQASKHGNPTDADLTMTTITNSATGETFQVPFGSAERILGEILRGQHTPPLTDEEKTEMREEASDFFSELAGALGLGALLTTPTPPVASKLAALSLASLAVSAVLNPEKKNVVEFTKEVTKGLLLGRLKRAAELGLITGLAVDGYLNIIGVEDNLRDLDSEVVPNCWTTWRRLLGGIPFDFHAACASGTISGACPGDGAARP